MSFSLVGEAGLEAADKHLECQALASSSTPWEHQKSSIRRPDPPSLPLQSCCKHNPLVDCWKLTATSIILLSMWLITHIWSPIINHKHQKVKTNLSIPMLHDCGSPLAGIDNLSYLLCRFFCRKNQHMKPPFTSALLAQVARMWLMNLKRLEAKNTGCLFRIADFAVKRWIGTNTNK